jgi:hypothetical protein
MIHLQIEELEKYMFTEKNMITSSSFEKKNNVIKRIEPTTTVPASSSSSSSSLKKLLLRQKSVAAIIMPEVIIKKKILKEEIVPRHKDKLFWCFYILYKGEHEYQQHMADNFITEKNFKIETAEKLKTMKDKFKQAKIRISEIEDELMNKPQITLKGLQALCLFYGVSLIYEFNQKYSEYLYNVEDEDAIEIITLKTKERGNTSISEYALKLFESSKDDGTEDKEKRKNYIKNIKENYWHIENADKPLKVPSAYTIKELQEIGEKLHLSLKTELGKNKTKAVLYEEILSKLY